MIEIVSEDNKKYKLLKRLLTSKGRKELNLFLAEGEKFLKFNPSEIFIHESYNIDEAKYKNVTVLCNKLFKNVSTQENSQGVICIFEIKKEKKIKDDFILILDKIRDPGNLGTIIRSAEFLGIKDIILINCVDIYNPKVVRATMGAIFNINFLNYWKEKILDLKKEFYKIVATSSNDYNLSLENLDIKDKLALVIGNETSGIDEFILKNCDVKITIPSFGSSESLNVSTAASILLYSISNKRRDIKK